MTLRTPLDPGPALRDAALLARYLDALNLVERLHRRLLDTIKDEFERLAIRDVNPVQALLLFNLADAEVSAGELRSRGCYQGSNVSYNLRKLVDLGYLHHQRSEIDRRSVRVRLTDKGRRMRDVVARLFATQAEGIAARGILDLSSLEEIVHALRRLERYWSDRIRYIY
ncbi:MarR family winged helix-turn-helix transcriptional regulator [Rubellimicrobium sp. CFH 75288]|uniref:MarR family winged helix-turn-helix transcriptional regulator n=1 Tax=Rubellimicrobium sp. CFH 75288 TaxID=2697034 RepID=UPI001412B8A7|nr:winged helix DNA-binding protein [Rubellimicrobium sp. CFH 75288]NAZ36503.1 winged helix DNA-binding protein [Rubellimicrobium sp. CFH 75288]